MTDKILVDSNVLLDLFSNDPKWSIWSEKLLEQYAKTHDLCINSIVYSEISTGFEKVEELEHDLQIMNVTLLPLPKESLFLAAKVFLSYRQRGGTRTSTLPDFFIGAHAAVENVPLLTRDIKRYKTYYPSVQLISPN